MNGLRRDFSWRIVALAASLACLITVAARGRAQDGRAAVSQTTSEEHGDLARKSDLLHSPAWQRVVAEFGSWLTSQSIYTPAEVRRIKIQFNNQVAAMSSYEVEYLLDSIAAKMRLLDTPEARDAKAWLGEYLSAMSDARRAQALRNVPSILDMSADQLWQEIQRIDALRATLRQRQQGVESRQATLAERAGASRQATAAASREAAARARSAPVHSPYRSGGGSLPFSDIPPRQMSIGVGPMGASIML